ncbi:S-layer homology domain-containing protein [Paenibacillus curdlanolyticus]|nr:S-layer homology domain-containing protein [Paenibacillus curdlanolyticus]
MWKRGLSVILVMLMVLGGVTGLLAPGQATKSAAAANGSWTYCADEGDYCYFQGEQEVRYGNGDYASDIFIGGVDCSNTVFGDPAPGVPKVCEVRDVQLDSAMKVTTSADHKTVTLTFNVFAKQAIADLKSGILIKKASNGSVFANLDADDTVAITESTAASSKLVITFKDALAGADDSVIKIQAGTLMDESDNPYAYDVESSRIVFGTGTPDDPYEIATADDLNAVRYKLDASYKLTADIDLDVSPYRDGDGWAPIGTLIASFGGVFDGNGHVITGLTINRPSESSVGLFGSVYNGTIRNVKLENVSVTGDLYVGGLAGITQFGTVENSSTTGSVHGTYFIGGIVGMNSYYTPIHSSYSTAEVTGSADIGGLVGANNGGLIDLSYATGGVHGLERVGGLAGSNYSLIDHSYATGAVSGTVMSTVGGLIGNELGTTTASFHGWDSAGFSQGSVSGTTKLNNVALGMEYSVNNGPYIPIITDVNSANAVDNIAANAGDILHVRVKVTPASGTTLTVGLADIKSATAPTAAALGTGTTAGATKLSNVTSAMEYRVNGGSYTAIAGTAVDAIGVNAGDVIAVRIAATAQQPASEAQTLTVGLADIKAAAAPVTAALGAGTNAGTTKLSSVTSVMAYSVNGGSYTSITGTTVDAIGVNAGDVIAVRIAATAQQPASDIQTLTVGLADIQPAAAPTTAALAVGASVGTTKLTNVTSAMEYAVNGGGYTAITDTSVDNIRANAGDVIAVRVKATAQQPASFAQTLTVDAGNIKLETVSGGGGSSTPNPNAEETPSTDPKPTVSFSDIAGHWAEANIKQAVSDGIVKGFVDGTFKPNRTVTRAEFAVMLTNVLKLQGEGAELAFTDTASIGEWAQAAIAQAVHAGIINGYEDGSFRPDAPISRAEMAVMLAHALKLALKPGGATGFADEQAIPAWAVDAVTAIKSLGLVQGKGNNAFDPNGQTTRAEAVTVLLKLRSN